MENQNTNPEGVQYPDPTKPVFKPHRQLPLPSKSWIIFIAANIIIPVTFAAIYLNLTKNSEPKEAIQIPTPSPTQTPTLTPASSSADTADWQTYTNTKRGYSFKYPTGYQLRTSEKTSTDFEGVYLEKDLKLIDSGTGGETAQMGSLISLIIFPTRDLTDSGLRNAYGRDIEIFEEVLGGKKITKVSQLDMYDSPKYFYKYDPDVLEIDLEIGFEETDENANNYLNIFNQILSTFKFSDSAAAPDSDSATANGVTITISPNHGPVGTKVNLKITGVKDFSNLTLFFKDSASGVPENGMGIAIRDINPVTGGFSGTYPIPSIVSSYRPNSQSPGPDVPTAKGMGSLRLTHGNDSQIYVTIPFNVE